MKKKKISIGDCQYNPKTRMLTHKDGLTKTLSRVPADLLELFYSHPEHYFTIQDLQEQIWSDKTIEKASIARWISSLRKELGETPDLIYIENKRNEGYRLVAEIKKPSIFKLKYLRMTITIGVLLSPIYITYLKYFETRVPSTPKTLTTLIGQEVDGAHDDGLLIFSHRSQGAKYWNLYAKKMGSGRSFVLTNNNYQNRRAVFSPDGKRIAFQRLGNGKCEIIVADISRAAMVLENETVAYDCIYDKASVSITWKDDASLFLSLRESLRGKYRVNTLDLTTFELVNIITPPSNGQGDYYVSYSQTVDKLVYFRNVGFAKTEIWMYNPKFSKSEMIASVPINLFSIAWINHDKELVFRTANGTLGKLDYIQNTPITNILSVNYPIRWLFSIDHDSIGYVHGHLRVRDIIKAKIGGEVETHVSSSFHDYLPVYAEESGSLVFVSTRSGNSQIWISDRNGELKQLTDFQRDYQISHLAISENGKVIAYTINTQIHVMTNTGNHLFSSDGDVVYKNPELSKEGKTLYYTINYDDTWRVESRNLDNIQSPVTHTEGHIMRSCEGFHCLYILRHNESQLYKLENGMFADTGIDLGDIQSASQFDITDDIIQYVELENGQLFLKQYDMINHTDRKLTQVPSRSFSLDIKNDIVYTSTSREAEIFLEQMRFPHAQ
ncbi:MAG: hypothetical protein GY781_03080 [Gammaproteobacteria bacterium]|nr:hypothetical protein [Gammaproteobacteria bacterium]